MSVQFAILDGDVTNVECDGLVTAVNSGRMWFGGVDAAIRRRVGFDYFHGELAKHPLSDGNVVIVGTGQMPSPAPFRNVVFVVDDLQQPLATLVRAALDEADRHELAHLAIPLMRTGVMAGVYESVKEAVDQLLTELLEFADRAHSVKAITVVIWQNPWAVDFLRAVLPV